MAIPESRKLFSDNDLKNLIMPLFMEQLLAVLVGVADTFMVSYAGEAAEYYMRKLLRLTFGASVLWNGFIFAVSPLVLKGFALSEEGLRLVLVLIAIHNLFNAVCHPFSNALPNGLRAAGDVRFTMYFSLLPTAVGRVVFSVIFGIWMKLGVIGVALAMCLDWVLRAVIFWRRFDGGKWKEFRVI